MVHCAPYRENRNVPDSLHSTRSMNQPLRFPALIAVECENPGAPGLVALDRATASILADAIALDLAAHVPEISQLDFIVVGALYDQAQLLRPQWPLHAALADALDRLPRRAGDAHVIALGSHDGRLPHTSLEPETALLGSPMLVMPWLLSGPSDIVASVAQRLERELMERGLIGAELALAIGEAFGIKTAHARHMSSLDLCALACAQYEHAELGELWQIIETALLRPEQSLEVKLGDGSSLAIRDGVMRCDSRNERLLAQTRAILGAHGISL